MHKKTSRDEITPKIPKKLHTNCQREDFVGYEKEYGS
jgi:hypothetical protein